MNIHINKLKMEFFNTFDMFSDEYIGFEGVTQNGSSSSTSTLILDSERGELVRAMLKPPQKAASADKALMALRNHSEAERRRRERINGHLATLRSLIPGTNKMDKAALLAEVINKVKELKRNVTEATNGTLLVPTDIDEVKVEEQENINNDASSTFSIRASLCCDFKHELLSDLKLAIESLPLKTVQSEIATLGSRMVNVFVIEGAKVEDCNEGCSVLVNTIRLALKSVLDKFYASEEFTSGNTLSGKRRRVSFFGSSNSSSALGDIIW